VTFKDPFGDAVPLPSTVDPRSVVILRRAADKIRRSLVFLLNRRLDAVLHHWAVLLSRHYSRRRSELAVEFQFLTVPPFSHPGGKSHQSLSKTCILSQTQHRLRLQQFSRFCGPAGLPPQAPSVLLTP